VRACLGDDTHHEQQLVTKALSSYHRACFGEWGKHEMVQVVLGDNEAARVRAAGGGVTAAEGRK
jgi:hypothetical protein